MTLTGFLVRSALWCIARRRAFAGRLAKLGSKAGGWVIPVDLFDQDSICYCAGVGEDITFDLALIERYGCSVFAFDPTPRAVTHVRRVASDTPGYIFRDVGVWCTDTVCRFYAPADRRHVSHSILNLQQSETYFEAPCRRLSTLMHEHGHQRIDLLKLDIEGAEHAVVADLLEDRIPVRVLCVEFDQPARTRTIVGTVRRLTKGGYRLVATDGWNCTFVWGDVRDGDGPVRHVSESNWAGDGVTP